MALDTTKVRRRLPQPPSNGSPAMGDIESTAPAREFFSPREAVPPRSGLKAGGVLLTDGRSLRATGRTVQLNLKTSPETKARFLALAQSRGVLMVDLFEQALDALEGKKASR